MSGEQERARDAWSALAGEAQRVVNAGIPSGSSAVTRMRLLIPVSFPRSTIVALEMVELVEAGGARDNPSFSRIVLPVERSAAVASPVLGAMLDVDWTPAAPTPRWSGPRWRCDGPVMWSDGDDRASVMTHAPGLATELCAELNAREVAALPVVAAVQQRADDLVAELRRQLAALERQLAAARAPGGPGP